MSDKKNETAFLVQGSILAVASIVSRVIGLVYRIPLNNILGEYGMDYYSCAYEIYSMMLLISSYSLPMAVSKMVSARMAKGERKNAYRVFHGALLIAVVTGLAGCLFVFFGAEFLTELMQTPMAVFALRVLAPTIFIVALLGVVRGFFQGLGTMVPSAISQILEQIINAVVSVVAAYLLFGYGTRVMLVLGSDSHYDAAYSAAGGTLGTGLGALTALIFCVLVFSAYRRKLKRSNERDNQPYEAERFLVVVRILIFTIIPVLLSTTLYNLVSIVDQGLFKNICVAMGYTADQISSWWGIYSGYYKVLINVPISIASALATSAVPAVSAAFARKETAMVRRKISQALRFVMVIAMPCTAGMIVLANPIIQLLFSGASPLAGRLMAAGGISIIFYSISTLSNAILQGIDRMRIPIRNALIALVVNVAAMAFSLYAFRANIYAMIIGNIVFSLVMCILNGWSVKKYSGFQVNIRKTFVKPAVSSVIMGACVYGAYHGIYRVFSHNSVCTVAAIFVGIVVYAVVLLLTKGLTEEELKSFPKGTLIIRIAKKCHLL